MSSLTQAQQQRRADIARGAPMTEEERAADRARIEAIARQPSPAKASATPRPSSGDEWKIETGNDLLEEHLPPLQWAVPDLLAEGTTLIVSPPKIGKSSWVLQISVALCVGGSVLERQIERKRPVLYLALEDGKRRMQDRLRTHLAPYGLGSKPDGFDYTLNAPTMGKGLEQKISAWYDSHPGGAVFIDTLEHVRPEHKGNKGVYATDVADIRLLRDIVRDRPGRILGLVHHTNKPNVERDFMQAVSGSYGIPGTVDTILRLSRPQMSAQGKLEVTGRDVPPLYLDVRYENLIWTIDNDVIPVSVRTPLQTDIYRWVLANGPAGPMAVASALKISEDSAGKCLRALHAKGELRRDHNGYMGSVGGITDQTTQTTQTTHSQREDKVVGNTSDATHTPTRLRVVP